MTSIGTRRTAWWAAVIALAAGLLATLALGVSQAVKAPENDPANDEAARNVVVDVAKSTTVKMLSYTPDGVENQLNASLPLLTGDYRDRYDRFIHDMVIPTARQNRVTTTAQVAGAGVTTLTRHSAVLILFINQTTTTGTAAPTKAASSVRVGMQKIDDQWLMDAFEPI